jgi:hypothetical protein
MRSIQITKTLFLIILTFAFALTGLAQSSQGSVESRSLRFASRRPVEHLRLQVHDAAGALIHDSGLVALGKGGSAEVTLPDWFEALNREFRYQLTCIGGFAPVYVAKKVNGNRFKIAGGKPGMEVSWQLTGVRKDAYAETHRVQVEEMKPVAERGSYLHPEAFGKTARKSVHGAREKARSADGGMK